MSSPHITTKKRETESVGCWAKGAEQRDCSQVAGPEVDSLGLSCPVIL